MSLYYASLNKALRNAIEEHLMELSPEIQTALYKLHELEAQLCVIGYEPIAAVVEEYRCALTDITEVDEQPSTAEKAVFCEAYEKQIMAARLITLRTLAQAYRKP